MKLIASTKKDNAFGVILCYCNLLLLGGTSGYIVASGALCPHVVKQGAFNGEFVCVPLVTQLPSHQAVKCL
jgi:hypothetical protein